MVAVYNYPSPSPVTTWEKKGSIHPVGPAFPAGTTGKRVGTLPIGPAKPTHKKYRTSPSPPAGPAKPNPKTHRTVTTLPIRSTKPTSPGSTAPTPGNTSAGSTAPGIQRPATAISQFDQMYPFTAAASTTYAGAYYPASTPNVVTSTANPSNSPAKSGGTSPWLILGIVAVGGGLGYWYYKNHKQTQETTSGGF